MRIRPEAPGGPGAAASRRPDSSEPQRAASDAGRRRRQPCNLLHLIGRLAWTGTVATLALVGAPACAAADAAAATLAALADEDQADRQPGPDGIDWARVAPRDAARRARVLELLREGQVRSEADHLNAALVFQHGETADDLRLAHALAQTARHINPESRAARWLAAASWDRLMMRLGQPQWYATQFVKRDGRWVLYPVNEAVVGDEERIATGARSLAAARAHAERMNAR
ncbi:hypothetical protein ABXN37_23015 [Piscinibacter sakaiensis]|uniref:hypothetical protein n=1 Tax=Piscinibacter sakaiensis TaxID=1547922 RepID=UPI00372BB2CB